MSRSPSPGPGMHTRLRGVSRASAGPAISMAGIDARRRSRRASSVVSASSLAPPGGPDRRLSTRTTESRNHSLAIPGGQSPNKRASTASVSSVKPRTSQFGLLNISTPAGRQSVMSTSSKKSRRGRMSNIARRISICSQTGGVSSNAQPHQEKNGWQTRHEKVCDRISCLFNCHTMSDIVFRIGIREIPAHKFILASASPVFYMSLFEKRHTFGGSVLGQPWRASVVTDGTQTPGTQSVGGSSWSGGVFTQGVLRISIDNYPFDAFFEFLRWLYTDDVMLSVSNVSALIFMADEFKVQGLGHRCFAFLRSEIRGDTVLRVLAIVRTLMSKAVICLWKEAVQQRKVMQEFKEMTLAERRQHLQNLAGTAASSRTQSRANSARSSPRGSVSDLGMAMRGGVPSSNASGIYDIYAESTGMDASFDAVTGNVNLFRKQSQLFHQLTAVSEELGIKCWKCVREHTDEVITCNAWVTQPLKQVRAILCLDVCNVPEISLFRAMNEWADKKCKLDGIPPLPEQKREVLGEDTIQLIRFPLLTLEQIQWEVVPSGLLTFKDVQSLQSIIAQGSPLLGKFNSEPRQHAMSEMMSSKRKSKGGLDVYDDGNGHRAALAPKNPVYNTEPGDEVDAIIGSHLLRSYVENAVDEHESQLAAFEAGCKAGGEETRAILCYSPTDSRLGITNSPERARQKSGNEQAQSSKTTPDDIHEPHQQKQHQLSQMLMFTPSWLAQELEEENQAMKAAETSPIQVRRGSLSSSQTTHTKFGDQPGPQDFARLSSGLYYFRGSQVLDMRIENGETMVYEHDKDDDDQKSENSFGCPAVEDLKEMPNEEAIRDMLGIAGKEMPEEKVTLASFLVRQ